MTNPMDLLDRIEARHDAEDVARIFDVPVHLLSPPPEELDR